MLASLKTKSISVKLKSLIQASFHQSLSLTISKKVNTFFKLINKLPQYQYAVGRP